LKIFIALSVFFINSLQACAVCYGAPDDPITMGMNKAILFLLITILFVLSCIIYGIVSIVKRSSQINIEGIE
tara:strand:- start:179 stop:394 length:216 start_codon:yes stop_codon:yes gene_type:complete